jgi:hypothetical protein
MITLHTINGFGGRSFESVAAVRGSIRPKLT